MRIYLKQDTGPLCDVKEDTPIYAVTDKPYEWGQLLDIKGVIFNVCCAGCNGDYVVVEPIPDYSTDKEELHHREFMDGSSEDGIYCPVCHTLNRDVCDYHEDDNEYICPICGSILNLFIEYTVTYNTSLRKINKDIIKI